MVLVLPFRRAFASSAAAFMTRSRRSLASRRFPIVMPESARIAVFSGTPARAATSLIVTMSSFPQ